MGNKLTPVQAAKELDIRPQIVYGFIRAHRARTYDNPGGKTQLVDLDEIRSLTGNVRHHREKDPSTGKPKRRVEPKLRTGTIIDMHAFHKGFDKEEHTPHRPKAVTGMVSNDAGEPSLVITTTGDKTLPMYWEVETLSERIAKGACHIESPENMLAVIMFHWVHNEAPELAASLDGWIQENGLTVPTITEVENVAKS